MGVLDARVLLLFTATFSASASAAVILANVKCDVKVVNFGATTLSAACGGSLSAELKGVQGEAGGAYSLSVLMPSTPLVLLSEVGKNVVTTMSLSNNDLPAEGEMSNVELTGNMPPTQLCGTGYLVVALSNGQTISQQLLSGPIPCSAEVVDLMWEFPDESMPAITVTPGQPINTDLILKLKNSGTTGLQSRLPLDSPEVKIIVAGEGTVPHYFLHETNMSMAEMSTSLLQTMRHLLLDGAPDTLVMMGRASGAEMLLVADDLTKSRDLAAGSTIDLDLSTLTVSPMKTFSYSYGLPGALIIVADPFNRTNDVDRSNNFAVLLVNFTSSNQGFGMDDAQNSVTKTCKVIPSVEDGGRSALLVSMHSMPYSFDDKTFGFSMADSKEVHEQLKESLRSDQLLARLQAMDRCAEEAYVATGDDPAAAVQNSVMAQLLRLLSSVRADAEKLQVQGDMAAEQHNTTLLIATALEDVFTTALEGDDKSKAFILQILVYKMKSIMMGHGMGMRPGKPMGGKFGPKGRPGRGMGRGSSQGGMPGGMSGFPGGMSGFPGGMNGFPGGMNGFPGGMNGFPGGMNGFPGGMSGSSGGGMSGPGGGMGSGFAESGQGQTRLNLGRRGGGNGGRNRDRSERRNGDRNDVDGSRNGGGGRRNRTRTQGPSVSPMTTSTTTTFFQGNGGIDDGLAKAGKSPADWGVQSDGTFRCQNGQLVDMFQIKCDGMKDCDDGSDEAECTGRSKRQSGDNDDDDDDDDYDDDDDDDLADVNDDFDDNDIDDNDDDDDDADDDDNSRGTRRGQGQRRRGGHDRDRSRQGRDDDDDDNDYDADGDDVIDIFVDVVMEAGDEREDDITIEKFEEALEDIVDENGRLPPAINDILSNSIFEMRGRDKPFSSSPMKKGRMSTLFVSFPSDPQRFGSRRSFRGRDRDGRRERRCSPYMKEKLEMKKVVSLMFMQLISKQPEDMKGFTFLPLSLRRSLKEAFTTIMRTGPPMVFKPFNVALRNNTQLQEMVGEMYMEAMMLPGDAKLETIFDFWRNNVSKVIRDELQGDTEMLQLLDLSEQYLDLLKPYLREVDDFSQMMITMMTDAMPKTKAFLNSRPGAEPSDEERCTRLARMAAEAMQASQMSIQATQSTLFESPFDMVVADQTNDGGPESPVYWRVENQDVLRGERCPLTGTMMWTKVAVCSCKNSFPQPPYFPPQTPFPGFGGMGPGGMGPGGMGPGGMGPGGMGPGGMGPGDMGSDGMGSDGMGSDGMGSDGMGSDGMGSDGMGFDGMGFGGMGQDGRGPGGFRPGRGSSGASGFGLNGQGMGGSGGRGNGGRGNGGGRGSDGFRGGGGGGNGFGRGQGGAGFFGMGQGGRGGEGFGMGPGGFGGDQDNGFGNPNRRNITNYFFDRDDDDDGDDDEYDVDDDNENAYSSSVNGKPVVFPGQNSAPPTDVNAIRELIQNALTNPDGSLNSEALGNFLGNQGTGSFDPQNPQVPKPGGGNIDMTSLQNAIKNIGANKPVQFPGVGSGLAQSGVDVSTLQNIFASQGGSGGQANSNRPVYGVNFGRAALQQAKANSAQVVDSQEIKSHLELNRRSEMELEDGTLEVSGEVLVGKERDDGKGFELGSVCDDGWSKEEASVVCKIIATRLSKNSAPLVRAEATATAHRAPDSKSPYKELEAAIKLDGVKCVGNETDILQCQHKGWGEHDCHNNEKASVTCIVR